MGKRSTLNAKAAAIGLVFGASLLHIVNQLDYQLVPIRLFVVAALVFAAWAFSDEMGLRKPLNRAAFVMFMFSMLALGSAIVNSNAETVGNLYLIYALSLMIAVLIWSIAFLHRKRGVKVVGAIGAAATAVPILMVIAGHVSVGAAAYFGFSELLTLSDGSAAPGSTPVNIIEAIFLCWAVIAAWMLWNGNISLTNASV